MIIIQKTKEELIAELKQHRSVGSLPLFELAWLADHGELRRYEQGEFPARQGTGDEEGAVGLAVVLTGSLIVTVNRGAGPRRALTWQAGDLTGVMPFSRSAVSTGDVMAAEPVNVLSVPREHFPELIRQCPKLLEMCVHAMIDRARAFTSSDWQQEKIMSLGKLAAGLAHELNNPASAVARSAEMLVRAIEEADRAAEDVCRARLSEEQLASIRRVRTVCRTPFAHLARSPLERADREDEIATWLLAHGADTSAVASLAETSVTIEALDELAATIQGPALDAALDWVAAGSEVRLLAAEIERASSRIYDLVAAVKGFTQMDRAHVQEPVDIVRGLRDTIVVLASKARAKGVTIELDVAPDLPRVRALAGELNQVWSNLIDNALDAVGQSGHITVAVAQVARSVVVRVIDDGPGIEQEIARKIYDPFFTTKEPGKGTGLGLDLVRRIVRVHGGEIEMESKPGRTEFRVALPAEQGLQPAVPSRAP